MTFEHQLIAGLDDIKAVTFECGSCKTRTTIPIEKLTEAPRACNSCSAIWWSAQDIRMGAFVTTSGSAVVGLVQAIVDLGDKHRVLGVGLVDAIQNDPRDRRFALVNDRLEDAPLHVCRPYSSRDSFSACAIGARGVSCIGWASGCATA